MNAMVNLGKAVPETWWKGAATQMGPASFGQAGTSSRTGSAIPNYSMTDLYGTGVMPGMLPGTGQMGVMPGVTAQLGGPQSAAGSGMGTGVPVPGAPEMVQPQLPMGAAPVLPTPANPWTRMGFNPRRGLFGNFGNVSDWLRY